MLNSTEATEGDALLSVSVFSQRYQWFKPAGLAKFDRMREEGHLDLVYENEMVKIYQVSG